MSDHLAAEAERLLKSVRHTHYQQDPVVDAKAGTYDIDCAAFVALLIENVAPEHFAQLPRSEGAHYPRAHEVHDFLAGKLPPGWRRVEKLADARPGDILAWHAGKVKPGHDTGHVAVVARVPEHHAAAESWRVHVHDSSSIVHFDDTRERGGKYHPGVGSGTLKFRVDKAGAPVAMQFGPGSEFHERAIVIGRLEELASPKKKASHGKEAHPSQPPELARGNASGGHQIHRAPKAGEVLDHGEYAITTYAIASTTAMLLAPAVTAYWGPGQKIPQSLGQGASGYTLIGGVVFRNA